MWILYYLHDFLLLCQLYILYVLFQERTNKVNTLITVFVSQTDQNPLLLVSTPQGPTTALIMLALVWWWPMARSICFCRRRGVLSALCGVRCFRSPCCTSSVLSPVFRSVDDSWVFSMSGKNSFELKIKFVEQIHQSNTKIAKNITI